MFAVSRDNYIAIGFNALTSNRENPYYAASWWWTSSDIATLPFLCFILPEFTVKSAFNVLYLAA
jgi:hypothetical protein